MRSAHVSTLGPQAVDVFYVQEAAAGALSEERAAVGRARRPPGAASRLPFAAPGIRTSAGPLVLTNRNSEEPPVFATLSDRLSDTFKNLRGKGRLSEADIDATAREIRLALLEADVALPVVKDFVGGGQGARPRRRGQRCAEPGPAGHQDRQRGARRDPRRRDPPAALRQDPADRDHARRPPGRRQDHAGRQARAAGSRSRARARCWSPPTCSGPTRSASSRSTASAPA